MAWLHPGMQLTVDWMDAEHVGHTQDFTEDADGNWTDAGGNHFSESDRAAGTSVGGVNVLRIVGIANGKVLVASDAWRSMRPVMADPAYLQLSHYDLAVAQAHFPGWWRSPDDLNSALQGNHTADIHIVPGGWRLPNNQILKVLHYWYVNDSGYDDELYDTASGLCVHQADSHTGAPPQLQGEGDWHEGDTILSMTNLLALRDVPLPWANDPMPGVISKGHVLHYAGASVFGQGFTAATFNIAWDATVQDSGSAWAYFANHIVTSRGNYSQPKDAPSLVGTNQIGGLWIGVNTLAALQQGQVIDQDPITNMRLSVSQVAPGTVTLAWANSSSEIDYTYDKSTGLMVQSMSSDMHKTIRTTLTLQSVE